MAECVGTESTITLTLVLNIIDFLLYICSSSVYLIEGTHTLRTSLGKVERDERRKK